MSKQYNKIDLLHLIVVLQLSGGWQHNFLTKTRHAGRTNEQSMYSFMSMMAQQCATLNFFGERSLGGLAFGQLSLRQICFNMAQTLSFFFLRNRFFS